MKKAKVTINFIKTQESLAAVHTHTHTHTCSFKRLKNANFVFKHKPKTTNVGMDFSPPIKHWLFLCFELI